MSFHIRIYILNILIKCSSITIEEAQWYKLGGVKLFFKIDSSSNEYIVEYIKIYGDWYST